MNNDRTGENSVAVNTHTCLSQPEAASFLQAASYSPSHFLPGVLTVIPYGWLAQDRGQQLLISELPAIPSIAPYFTRCLGNTC